MTDVETKEECSVMATLRRMRQLMKRIPSILWEIEQKEANATRVTTNITGMPRGGSSTNRTEDANIALIDVKDAYREALAELESLRAEMEPVISRLEDEDERGIMRMRYIHGYDPEKIAKAILYHPRTIYRKLKRAERKLIAIDNRTKKDCH